MSGLSMILPPLRGIDFFNVFWIFLSYLLFYHANKEIKANKILYFWLIASFIIFTWVVGKLNPWNFYKSISVTILFILEDIDYMMLFIYICPTYHDRENYILANKQALSDCVITRITQPNLVITYDFYK